MRYGELYRSFKIDLGQWDKTRMVAATLLGFAASLVININMEIGIMLNITVAASSVVVYLVAGFGFLGRRRIPKIWRGRTAIRSCSVPRGPDRH
jgi:hypothetical protein